MTVHLETDRLVLREFIHDDYRLLADLDSDPEVLRYLAVAPPTESEQRDAVARCISSYRKYPGFGFYIALEKPALTFIGWFHFRPDRKNPEDMEIGYRLKRSAWGRGLATEGSRALIERGWKQGVTSVSGRTAKRNLMSRNVLEKCGLRLVEEYDEPRIPGEDKTAILLRLEAPTPVR